MDEIFRRGTCRYFKEKMPVPDDELLTLVKAGMQARAVGNQKSRDFIIVTREDLVKAISHNSIIAGPARKASAAIVIVGKRRMAFPSPRNGPLTVAKGSPEYSGGSRTSGTVHPVDAGLSLPGQKNPPLPYSGYSRRAGSLLHYCRRLCGQSAVRMNRYDPDAVFLDLYGSHKKTVYTGK